MSISTTNRENPRISLILWGSISLLCLIEIFLPRFCIWNFRNDLLEQIMIGREWVLTSNKHPALTSWVAQIFWVGTNHSEYALYFASAVCVFLSFLAIWKLGREFLTPEKNLFATLAMMAYWYFNIGATRFNNNITLMPCWLWAIWFFYRALKTGKNSWWLLTGLMLGIGLNCKYTCIILCLAMVIYLILERDARRFWKTSGPWLTVGVTALVFLPHVLAVWENWDVIYAYITNKKTEVEGILLLDLLMGWLTQLGVISAVVIALFPLFRLPMKREKIEQTEPWPFRKTFLAGMFFLPMVVLLGFQLYTQVAFPNRSYGFHLWGLTGVYLLATFQTTETRWHWKLSALWIGLLTFVQLISLPVLCWNLHQYSPEDGERFYPGKALAAECDQVWTESFPGVSCPFVTALRSDYLAWNVTVFSRFQPRIITPIGNWAKDEDLNRSGGIILWEKAADDPLNDVIPEVKERFPNAIFKKDLALKYQQKNPKVPLLKVGVAVVAPVLNE